MAAVSGGGLLAAAFLQAAVAAADIGADGGSATGASAADTIPTSLAATDGGGADIGSGNGFTAPDGLTLDPGADGYNSVTPLFSDAPLLSIGGASVPVEGQFATQNFDVYDADGNDLGSVDTGVMATNLLGIDSVQYTVTGTDPAGDEPSASDIYTALTTGAVQDSNFSGGGLNEVVSALQGDDNTDVLGGSVTGDQITDALHAAGISITGPDTAGEIADHLNSAAASGDDLPVDGTTYSITALPLGLGENVYEATPNSSGDAAQNIQDVLVTPLGNIDLSTPFDAIANIDPGSATAGVNAAAGAGPGDIGSGNGFTAPDGLTLDPGADGYNSVTGLFGDAPLLQIAGGSVPEQGELATQDFAVYNGDGDQIGAVQTGVNASNVLGIESAQFTVTGNEPTEQHASAADIYTALTTSADQNSDFSGGDLDDVVKALHDNDGTDVLGNHVTADQVGAVLGEAGITPDASNGITDEQIADALNNASAPESGTNPGAGDLPADGTTYNITALPLGLGENVYEATPNSDGTGAADIKDVLVTPLGNIDLSTPFDAIANLDPGSAAAGVNAGGGAGPGDIGSGDGFTAPDGLTLDPGDDGYQSVTPLFGNAPILQIGGGTPVPDGEFASQDLDVYNSDGDQIGTVSTGVTTTDLLGIDSAQFTVTGNAPLDADASISDISNALATGGDVQDSDFSGGNLADAVKALHGGDNTDVLGDHVTAAQVSEALDSAGLSLTGNTTAEEIASDLNSATGPGAVDGADAADLPADGTTYSITNFGGGFENFYEATPADDGGGSSDITDVLVTPFGNVDLSTPFDVLANLMPGAFVPGVDAGSGGGLFAGLGDLGLGDLLSGGDGADEGGGLFGDVLSGML